jgi:hypothetical protein
MLPVAISSLLVTPLKVAAAWASPHTCAADLWFTFWPRNLPQRFPRSNQICSCARNTPLCPSLPIQSYLKWTASPCRRVQFQTLLQFKRQKLLSWPMRDTCVGWELFPRLYIWEFRVAIPSLSRQHSTCFSRGSSTQGLLGEVPQMGVWSML